MNYPEEQRHWNPPEIRENFKILYKSQKINYNKRPKANIYIASSQKLNQTMKHKKLPKKAKTR